VAQQSAGVVLFRWVDERLEVLLVHPGGPFWARRDEGAWSIPKGEVEPGEELRVCALREFAEETGTTLAVDGDELIELGDVRLRSGKRVTGFACPGDLDAEGIVSVTFELEWPPRSGRHQAFPEVDRAAWLPLPEAHQKLLPAQAPFLERLAAAVG
jgi:predicted NUDIX family NTP pyrophosphohydrolase